MPGYADSAWLIVTPGVAVVSVAEMFESARQPSLLMPIVSLMHSSLLTTPLELPRLSSTVTVPRSSFALPVMQKFAVAVPPLATLTFWAADGLQLRMEAEALTE